MSFNKETKKYEGFIYCITNRINKKQYIGQTTKTVDFRWQQHQYRSTIKKYTQHLYNAMSVYGVENFHVSTLCSINEKSSTALHKALDKLGIEYIDKYNSFTPNGYNMTNGADFNPTYLTAKKVIQMDLTYKLLNEFDSIKQASEITGLGWNVISKCCKNKRIMFNYGYLFCFVENYNAILNSKDIVDLSKVKSKKHIVTQREHYNNKMKKIHKFDLDFNFIESFSSIKDAAISSKVSATSISMCCQGKTNKSGGYIWRYTNDIPEFSDNIIRINQFNLSGELIGTFASISVVCAKFNLLKVLLLKSCCNENYQYAGFYWRYSHAKNSKPLAVPVVFS